MAGQFDELMNDPAFMAGISLLGGAREENPILASMAAFQGWQGAQARQQELKTQAAMQKQRAKQLEIETQRQKKAVEWAQSLPVEGGVNWTKAVVEGAKVGAIEPQHMVQMLQNQENANTQKQLAQEATHANLLATLASREQMHAETEERKRAEAANKKMMDQLGLEIRRSNLAVQQSMLAIAQQNANTRQGETSGKAPSGYRFKPDGTLEAIPGGPGDPSLKANKPLAEWQGKAATFATQMDNAEGNVTKIEGTGKLPSPMETRLAGSEATNWAASEPAQQYAQAQEQWAEAYLRFKTGAATNADEIRRNVATYFPRIGDKEATIKQKAEERVKAVQTLKTMAERGELPWQKKTQEGPSESKPVSVDDLVNKYRTKK